MTAVTEAVRPPRRAAGPTDLAGTGVLLRLALRRDRVMLPVWVWLLTVTSVSTAGAFKSLYSTAAERASLAHSVSTNSSLRAMYGPVFSDSLGGLVAWRVIAFGGVLVAVMSLVIVVRHTRDEEESGRQELLLSAVVGRRAPLTSALLAALAANALVALFITSGLIGLGLPGRGAVAFGLVNAGLGLCFAGLAAVTAQLTESGRAAKGLAGTAVGIAFLLHVAGDAVSDDGSSPLLWISPIGWAENARAFAGDRWWVVLLPYGAAMATAAGAYALAGRRDFGAGMLPARPGAPAAPRYLGGPYGLAWRLQRGSLLGWGFGFTAGGLVMGGIAKGAADLVGDSARTREIIQQMGGQQGLTDAFLASMLGMLGMIASVYAVGSVLRLRGEETDARAEPVLAASVGRLRWALSHLVFAFAGTGVVLLLGGLGMGIAYGAAVGDVPGQLPSLMGAALAQLPAVWVAVALAVLLFGVVPKASVAAWVAVGGWLAIGWLGAALRLPQAAMDLSPFTHLPKLPGAEVSAAPFLWLLLLAAVLTACGLTAFCRRDLD
jgi:ABC-2 type transport system permease protein